MLKSLCEDSSNISCVQAWSCSARRAVVTEVFLFCRARAIGYRQHNREAVGGFFSQIGNLYMVHHLWGTVIFIVD